MLEAKESFWIQFVGLIEVVYIQLYLLEETSIMFLILNKLWKQFHGTKLSVYLILLEQKLLSFMNLSLPYTKNSSIHF